MSCLGKSHADAARSGTDCTHCESFSLASLCSRIAFFSESDSVPRTLLFSSSQGPVRKKQRGRGFEQPVTSELMTAQCPRASPSPQREHSPVLFTQHDQRPSAAASDMILFGVSDNELDDSLSLAASDAEELSGSVTDPALLLHLKMKEADKVPFLDAPVSSGSLFGPAVEGFAGLFTEAQKSSQAMRHFLPKRTSSSTASSCPRPAPTQQIAKPMPATPEPDLLRVGEIEGAHARHDATPSRSAKDPGPKSPWVQRLRSPLDQPGRKRRGPSLATAGPPCKQPLMCLSPPRLTLGAEESEFLFLTCPP